MQNESGNKWRQALAQWAIPKEILDQAPEDPWIHPPALFQIPDQVEDSPSHEIAREALTIGGSVLDIGCGGGMAAFALTPPAAHVIGVDHQSEMLVMFAENARKRSVTSEVFEGFWPAMADGVPSADVAVAHNVVYNVQNIEDFLQAMNDHAKNRVVIEMPQQHPLATAAPLWKHFWNIERPTTPTPGDLMEVLAEQGIDAKLKLWDGAVRQEADLATAASYSRIRLCLPAEREGEVLEFLESAPRQEVKKIATLWWDIK